MIVEKLNMRSENGELDFEFADNDSLVCAMYLRSKADPLLDPAQTGYRYKIEDCRINKIVNYDEAVASSNAKSIRMGQQVLDEQSQTRVNRTNKGKRMYCILSMREGLDALGKRNLSSICYSVDELRTIIEEKALESINVLMSPLNERTRHGDLVMLDPLGTDEIKALVSRVVD